MSTRTTHAPATDGVARRALPAVPLSTARLRRRTCAAALTVAPVLVVLSDAMRLRVEGVGEVTASEHLAAIERSEALWTASGLVALLAAMLYLPAVVGLLRLVPLRGALPAHAGAALLVPGLFAYAGVEGTGRFLDAALSRTGAERAELQRLADAVEGQTGLVLVVVLFVVGFTLGHLLLGIGLLRARTCGRAAPALVLAGPLVGLGGGGGIVGTAGLALTAVGLALAGRRLIAAGER